MRDALGDDKMIAFDTAMYDVQAVAEAMKPVTSPLVNVVKMFELQPPDARPDDNTPLKDVLPSPWPTLGDLRMLVKNADLEKAE